MPEYLLAMRNDVKEELYDVVDENINRTIDKLYGKDSKIFTLDNERVMNLYAQDPLRNQLEVKTKLQEYYIGFIRNVSFIFAEYPRSKTLGFYNIKIKINSQSPCF